MERHPERDRLIAQSLLLFKPQDVFFALNIALLVRSYFLLNDAAPKLDPTVKSTQLRPIIATLREYRASVICRGYAAVEISVA